MGREEEKVKFRFQYLHYRDIRKGKKKDFLQSYFNLNDREEKKNFRLENNPKLSE